MKYPIASPRSRSLDTVRRLVTRARFSLLALGALVALGACRRDAATADRTPTPEAVATTAPAAEQPAATVIGGRVSGRITLDGPPPPQVTRVVTVDPELCGSAPIVDREMLVDPETKGIRYAVVTLTNDTAAHAVPAPVTRTLEQARCEYFPYVTVVPPGSTIVVTNSDPGLHDVHVMRDGMTQPDANHSLRADGRVELVFPERGNVLLGCDLHYWARAWVLIDPAPFAAITDAEGRYSFAGVPPGAWRVTVWQERLGTTVRDVIVDSDTSAVVENVALPPPTPTRPVRP